VEDDQVPDRPFVMALGGPVRVVTGAGVDVRAGPALKIVGGEWGHVSDGEPRRRGRLRQATHSSGRAEASSLLAMAELVVLERRDRWWVLRDLGTTQAR